MQRCNKEAWSVVGSISPLPPPSMSSKFTQSSCRSQQLQSHSHPLIITLESLWLCTPPIYYCQPIKTKTSRIMKRIMLYTRETESTGEYYQLHPSVLILRSDGSLWSSIILPTQLTRFFLDLLKTNLMTHLKLLNYCLFIQYQE